MNINIPQTDYVYLNELQNQCDFALVAIASSKDVLKNSDVHVGAFWYHIQMFLTSTANIHKMLYNKKDLKYKEHHEEIKSKYNFPDIDFTVENQVRNRFEHYDERIVDWIYKPGNRGIATSNIMPKKMIEGGPEFFKNYDPVENQLSFGEKEFNVNATVERISQLHKHIQGILEP